MTIISRMTETRHLPRRHPANRAAVFTPSLRTCMDLLRDRLLEAVAPMGYEDEFGFHYGFPPAQKMRPVRIRI